MAGVLPKRYWLQQLAQQLIMRGQHDQSELTWLDCNTLIICRTEDVGRAKSKGNEGIEELAVADILRTVFSSLPFIHSYRNDLATTLYANWAMGLQIVEVS